MPDIWAIPNVKPDDMAMLVGYGEFNLFEALDSQWPNLPFESNETASDS